ncbi:MAG: type II toxin-antitoxin system VapC family toxin [Chloroflexi bacterium]|nr:type II toxin-antitoxin system VapC family toxin [Chloroflexota bacterium]
MTTNDKVFCDTNVVIRLNIVETPEHQQVKAAVARLLDDGNTLWISRQVLREFCMVLTRPQTFPTPPTAKEVVARARALSTLLEVADEPQQVTENLFRLIETIPMGGKQVYDANIVATMQAYDIRYIFTLNPSDFHRFSDYIHVITLTELLHPLQ